MNGFWEGLKKTLNKLKGAIMSKKRVILSFIGAILPIFILIVLLQIHPVQIFSCDPKNISATFNITDQNSGEQIQGLSINYLGSSIDYVQLDVEGSLEGIMDLNKYINYISGIKNNLSFIEKNITDLNISITKSEANSILNKSEKNLKSIEDDLSIEINELNASDANKILWKNRDCIKNLEDNFTIIDSDIIKTTSPIYNLIYTTASSSSPVSNAEKPDGRMNITNIESGLKFIKAQIDELNIDHRHVFITPMPQLIGRLENSDTKFSSIKIILLNDTPIGSYVANIVLHKKDDPNILKSVPVRIKVSAKKS